jgi:hypothetical protein
MHIINLIISASTIYVEWDNGFDGIFDIHHPIVLNILSHLPSIIDA